MEEVSQQADGSQAIDDSIEARIQGQFNEEKWTRISSKDVTISRFKLLEDLLDEAVEKNNIEELSNLSQEQLKEYDASVAARYFLGMIALKQDSPEGVVHLKQLLDQFEESSKWAVVDFLSDKMLAVSENRTILRAKANALEKLGKTKELIPVLEKLAKLDRKNPDIALKYADAILQDDLEKAIQYYKMASEAYAKNQQFEKLKSVWNKLVDLIPEDFNYYRKIERILGGHRQKDILADLFVQLTYHYIKQEDVDNIIMLSKKILDLNPNYSRFKNELIRSYRAKYQDHSLLEDFIKYSGLLDSRKNIGNSILNFETNIVFDKENYVFHRLWGVGKIKDLDTTQMIIDFKDKPAHKMEIQMALKSLKPLQPDHFWVHQYEKPEELQKMFDEEFVSFFKILISSFGNQISLSDIKAEIADIYVPLKNWSKWWTKKRAELLKDNLIRVSPQRKDILELHQSSVSFSDGIIEKFQGSQSFEDRMAVAFEALKDPDEGAEAIEYMVGQFKDSMRSLDIDIKLQSTWMLELFKEALGEEDDYYDEKLKKEIINELSSFNIEKASLLSLSFKNTELKKRYAKWVHDYHPEWKRIYVEMLMHTPIKIHKNLMAELVANNAVDAIQEFFTRLRKESKTYAEIFIWTVKNLITGAWQVEGLAIEEQILGFFRLLRNIPKIELKGTKLKNAAREMVLGSSQDEMIAAVEKYAKDSVRKFSSLFKDVSFFTDLEKQKVKEWLVKINPDAFEQSEIEAAADDSDDSLIEELEKTGKIAATKNASQSIHDELEHVLRVEIPKNSEEIGLAQEKGDLRENAEYKAALEKQSILQSQATKLENDLKQIRLITSHDIKIDRVNIGTKVKLKDAATEDIFVYSILDQWDADVDKGIISYKSPLGAALLDKRKGEVAEFGSGNQEQKLEILSIDVAVNGDGFLV